MHVGHAIGKCSHIRSSAPIDTLPTFLIDLLTTSLVCRWNYAVSGLNPWSYHAVNILLHSLVSCLFAWICHNCLGLSTLGSLLTASLFAIHPIHTEAVSRSLLVLLCQQLLCKCQPENSGRNKRLFYFSASRDFVRPRFCSLRTSL
jgi:hypothetical protein